jgi:Holliday junction resolvasome RuvABC DNA-binding subunit
VNFARFKIKNALSHSSSGKKQDDLQRARAQMTALTYLGYSKKQLPLLQVPEIEIHAQIY